MTTATAVQLKGLRGVLLKVHDMPRAMRFYRDTLGFSTVFETESIAVFNVGGAMVELLCEQATKPTQEAIKEPGLPDLAEPAQQTSTVFVLGTDDCDDSYRALNERGVEFLSPPHDRHWGERTCFFRDPDGYVCELAQPLPHGPQS